MATLLDIRIRLARNLDRMTDKAREMEIELVLARETIRRLRQDAEGYLVANQVMHAREAHAMREVENLRRELREMAS